jgi:EAL domain-containing protein (putative c-di-GMP-specific phosphodiesterase class I)
MPLRELKIDQSFVHDVPDDANAATIARAVISLGRELGLHVVAEGVETAAQHEFLKAAGCQFFQGHRFGAALPAADFERLVVGMTAAPLAA